MGNASMGDRYSLMIFRAGLFTLLPLPRLSARPIHSSSLLGPLFALRTTIREMCL